MSDCDHKWSLMRVPYECPYCLRERAERAEAERDALRAKHEAEHARRSLGQLFRWFR